MGYDPTHGTYKISCVRGRSANTGTTTSDHCTAGINSMKGVVHTQQKFRIGFSLPDAV